MRNIRTPASLCSDRWTSCSGLGSRLPSKPAAGFIRFTWPRSPELKTKAVRIGYFSDSADTKVGHKLIGLFPMKNVSIRIKITLFIVLFLLFAVAIVLFLSMSNSRKSLSVATDRTLRTNAQTIDRAIQSIMLSGEAPIAVRTIRSLQEIQGLEQIDLYRTNGLMAFHDYETLDLVNAQQQAFQFSRTPRIGRKELDTSVFQDIINKKQAIKFEDKQNQHFEYYYPFQNKPECQMCHGKSKDLLGVLHLKISTADLNMQIKKAGFMLSAILIVAGVLIAFCLILFLNRLILDPLVKIGGIVAQVGQGNFDVKVEISR